MAGAAHVLEYGRAAVRAAGFIARTMAERPGSACEEHGLPKGPYGKIGVAVAANSDRVYALIEAHNPDGGLYRSDDGGDSWQLVNPSHSLWQRPWYYMHVIADPRDENVLYIMDVDAYKSTDGGASVQQGARFRTATITGCGSIRRTRSE